MLIAHCSPLSGLKQISCPAKTFELVLCYRFTSYCSWNVKGGGGAEGGEGGAGGRQGKGERGGGKQ
jgi:hypothetical protein